MRYIILIAVLSSTYSNVAMACSCLGPAVFDTAHQEKEQVFLAQISHYEPKTQELLEHGKLYENVVYLVVLEIFKGSPGRQIEASTKLTWTEPGGGPYLSSSCATIGLDKDRPFFVFRNNNEAISLGTCSKHMRYFTEERLQLLRKVYG